MYNTKTTTTMTKKNFSISAWSSISITFKNEETKEKAVTLIEKNFPGLYFEDRDECILIEYQTSKTISAIKKFLRTL